jgi:type III secretion protein K
MPAAAAPETRAVPGPMDLVRLVTRFNLHPEAGLHPSWLPAAWPARHRVPSRFGPAGQAVLAELLQRRHTEHAGAAAGLDFQFDSRLKRLVLIDAASLRRLAVYMGFCVHLPLFKQRGGAGAQLRRQARRYDEDAVDFVLDRVPPLSALQMDHQPLLQRPVSAGRVAVQRGYRLLLGAAAPEGEAVLRRLQHKLPRRVSALGVPVLEPRQLQQLHELMLLCIVPERLPQWDWLF